MASDPRVWLAEAQERAEEYRPTMDLEVVHDWAGESVNDTIEVTAALTAVLGMVDRAEADASSGMARMFGGDPFPATVSAEGIRAAITDALGGDRG